jgi:hypothetical protein
MTFHEYLNKYNVKYKTELLSYTPWLNRNGQKLTRIIAHTEGAPQIEGTADRDLFNYFNGMMSKPPSKRANAQGYITFSGLFIEYIDIANGSWNAGNDDDNVQSYAIETQDNGRWADPSTYTVAQYDTWARVYCAVKDYAKEHYGTNIQFNRGVWGIRRHNEIDTSRACPGALNVDKIVAMASELWQKTNNPKNNLYRIIKDGKQLNAYEKHDNAFNFWYTNGGEVIYNGLNITEEFKTMANTLEKEVQGLKKEVEDLKEEVKKSNGEKEEAQVLCAEFRKSIFYRLYLLVNRK